MNRLAAAVLVASMLLAGMVLHAPAARACSIAPTFAVTLDHLAQPDFNQPDSRLAADYREWYGEDDVSIEVLGVYVYETIHTVEPKGDWSRGSVSVAVEMWGEWPDDLSPHAINPEDRSGQPPDSCGWGPTGNPVGTRTYTVVSNVSSVRFITADQDPDGVLTAAFGAPAIAERNTDLEQELIAQIEATRNSSTALFVAVGVIAIAIAGGVLYVSRRSRGPLDADAPSGQ